MGTYSTPTCTRCGRLRPLYTPAGWPSLSDSERRSTYCFCDFAVRMPRVRKPHKRWYVRKADRPGYVPPSPSGPGAGFCRHCSMRLDGYHAKYPCPEWVLAQPIT